jgi:hypothetical protein
MSDRNELRNTLMKADAPCPVQAFTEYGVLKVKIANMLNVMTDLQDEGRKASNDPLMKLLYPRLKDLYRQLDEIGLEKRKTS